MIFRYRHSEDRGKAEHGWLHARFTFSFSGYYDPDHCGFHSLIVMNNDIIEPGGGFPVTPMTMLKYSPMLLLVQSSTGTVWEMAQLLKPATYSI